MDYEFKSFLRETRDSLFPSVKKYIGAKTAEANAHTALLQAELVEQDYRNKNAFGYFERSMTPR